MLVRPVATLASLFTFAIVACGGELADPPNVVHGSVSGVRVEPASSVAITFADATSHGASIGLTNPSYTCGDERVAGSKWISVSIQQPGASGPIAPGTYAIVQPTDGYVGAAAIVSATDDACHDYVDAAGASGSVTIESSTDAEIVGSFDVVFETGERMDGHFDALVCERPAAGTSPGCRTP